MKLDADFCFFCFSYLRLPVSLLFVFTFVFNVRLPTVSVVMRLRNSVVVVVLPLRLLGHRQYRLLSLQFQVKPARRRMRIAVSLRFSARRLHHPAHRRLRRQR